MRRMNKEVTKGMNIQGLHRLVRARKIGRQTAERRYREGRGQLLHRIRKAAGLSQRQLVSRLGLLSEDSPRFKAVCDQMRRWERGDNWPRRAILLKYLSLGDETLGQGALAQEERSDLARALSRIAHLVGDPDRAWVYGPLPGSGQIPGQLTLRLPMPAPQVEEMDMGDDGDVSFLVSWHESNPIQVRSGDVQLGEARETLQIGPVTISPDDQGLHLEFPPDWKIQGVSDRWAEHCALYAGPSRRRLRLRTGVWSPE